MRGPCLAAFSAIALAAPVFGQTYGQITGQVPDSSGAVIADATINAVNVSNNASRQTISSAAGDYSIPSLPPGIYNLRVEKTGFKVAEVRDVDVQVQQTVRLDFSLTVGEVTQS